MKKETRATVMLVFVPVQYLHNDSGNYCTQVFCIYKTGRASTASDHRKTAKVIQPP